MLYLPMHTQAMGSQHTSSLYASTPHLAGSQPLQEPAAAPVGIALSWCVPEETRNHHPARISFQSQPKSSLLYTLAQLI